MQYQLLLTLDYTKSASSSVEQSRLHQATHIVLFTISQLIESYEVIL